MSLTDSERHILRSAGATADLTARRRAVAVYLSKRDADHNEARALMVESFLEATQPSFHLIPHGDAMFNEAVFVRAYGTLAAHTENFANVSEANVVAALTADHATLAPLRMIAGLTYSELAVSLKLIDPTSTASGETLKSFERGQSVSRRHATLLPLIARTVRAILDRTILSVPPEFEGVFHSKIERRDTQDGWTSVAHDATHGVPYQALLYQRYVGGLWRQVQDSYSEVKGDAILELPLSHLLDNNGIPYYRAATGASGARATVERFGIQPGPDFVLPDESPTVVIECKVCEDGGTVRDKAERIQALAAAARALGLIACAVVDGKGWRERANALVDVIAAVEGRVYTLNTLPLLLGVPEIATLRHTRPNRGD